MCVVKAPWNPRCQGMSRYNGNSEAGPRLDAALASATLAVYVAAYGCHRAQDHVRVAERAGLAVVTVPVGGAEAFRRAVVEWCAATQGPHGADRAAALTAP